MMPKILIAGATGVVGYAALEHFESRPEWEVVGVSRRKPPGLGRAQHVSVDLTDEAACADVFGAMDDVTHVVYSALYERPGLHGGWTGKDDGYLNRNLQMLRNLFEPLERASSGLTHISLLQGTKAYGVHLGITPRVPLRESQPRVEHANFYFAQQDYLAERQAGKPWAWTVWRPVLIFGEAPGNPLSMIPPIAVYASILRERGEPLHYPGNPGWWEVRDAIDSQMIAAALEWAATSGNARNEVYNIANGDVFVWQEIWPVIAEAFGMEPGEERPLRLAETMPTWEDEWLALAERHDLQGPRRFEDLVGQGFTFADYVFGHGREPGIRVMISAITKLRQHGFHQTVDTEEMFRKWVRRLQDSRVIPPAHMAEALT
jgi:nucleoside-diphosphate-sugar epimerase